MDGEALALVGQRLLGGQNRHGTLR
jgi:hypothetical protein